MADTSKGNRAAGRAPEGAPGAAQAAPAPMAPDAPVTKAAAAQGTTGAAQGTTGAAPAPQAAAAPKAGGVAAARRGPKAKVVSSGTDKSEFGQVRGSVLFLGAVFVAYICYLVLSGTMDEFVAALGGVDLAWVLRGALCFCCYYVLGVIGYVVPTSQDRDAPLGFRDLMSVEAAGIFFSFLTPGGTGAAPAQIYRFTRTGMSIGAASALQYTRFIIYEFSEGLFAAIMLIFRYQYFFATIGNFAIVGLVLFGCKVIEVAALLVVCLSPGFVKRVGNWAIDFGKRHNIGRNYDHWHEVVNVQVQEFSDGFKSAARDLPMMGIALVVSMTQLGCQYALGWFVAEAFGIHADLLTCLAAGSMLELLTSAVPLPGGEGGAEAGFAMLFRPVFGDVSAAAYVVWRLIEYFGPIVGSIPLLGLRSHGGPNVYQQVHRWGDALRRFRAGLPGAKRAGRSAGGVRVDPSRLARRAPGHGAPSAKTPGRPPEATRTGSRPAQGPERR